MPHSYRNYVGLVRLISDNNTYMYMYLEVHSSNPPAKQREPLLLAAIGELLPAMAAEAVSARVHGDAVVRTACFFPSPVPPAFITYM